MVVGRCGSTCVFRCALGACMFVTSIFQDVGLDESGTYCYAPRKYIERILDIYNSLINSLNLAKDESECPIMAFAMDFYYVWLDNTCALRRLPCNSQTISLFVMLHFNSMLLAIVAYDVSRVSLAL